MTRCSNNYGPYQFPEKLVPLIILRALADEPVPVYGDGLNVRDWIHVEDHCAAVFDVLMQGRAGEIYNVGADSERKNLDLVRSILSHLGKGEDLIEFVPDRPGHDRRYAIDSTKSGLRSVGNRCMISNGVSPRRSNGTVRMNLGGGRFSVQDETKDCNCWQKRATWRRPLPGSCRYV